MSDEYDVELLVPNDLDEGIGLCPARRKDDGTLVFAVFTKTLGAAGQEPEFDVLDICPDPFRAMASFRKHMAALDALRAMPSDKGKAN